MELRLSSQKNKAGILLVILVFVSIFTLPTILEKFYTTNQTPPPEASGANASLCLINCTSSDMSIPIDQPFTLPVIVNTDQNDITKVVLAVHYDTVLMKLVDLNPVAKDGTSLKLFSPYDSNGNFQKNEVIAQSNGTGVLRITAETAEWVGGTVNKTQPYSGSTNLILLTFQPQAYGKSRIYLEKKLDGENESQFVRAGDFSNVLNSTSDANVSVTGAGQSSVPSISGGVAADVNSDGTVNASDVDDVSDDIGKTGSPGFTKEDVNKDGKVDIFDRNAILNQASQ